MMCHDNFEMWRIYVVPTHHSGAREITLAPIFSTIGIITNAGASSFN